MEQIDAEEFVVQPNEGPEGDEGNTSSTMQIRLAWGNTGEVPTIYANQLYVTHAGGEFYLIFGEIVLPTVDNLQGPLDHLDVRPVAKIVVTPETMRVFTNAIDTNLANYLGRVKPSSEQK